MKRIIIIFVLFLVLLIIIRFLIIYFTGLKSENLRKMDKYPCVNVEVVKANNLVRSFSSTARISAKYRVDVLSRVNGYLLKSHFKEGDYVKSGQILFEIEPDEYIYALEEAKADLSNAEAQYSFYEKQLLRYRDLVNMDYIAKSEYDNVLAQRNSYKSTVERAKNVLNDAQRNLSYTKIKSPVDGRVGIINVTVGNYVTTNKGALTTINSNDPMYVIFHLDKKEYSELLRIDKNINLDRTVEFIFSTGEKYKFKGVQDFLDNKVDEATGAITMRATFPNTEGELIHGDLGKVLIYAKLLDPVPFIPVTSVMENQEGKFVYLLDENDLPKISYIKIFGQDDKNCYIKSGVKLEDRIITKGLQRVVPGKPVNFECDKKG